MSVLKPSDVRRAFSPEFNNADIVLSNFAVNTSGNEPIVPITVIKAASLITAKPEIVAALSRAIFTQQALQIEYASIKKH